MSEVSKFFDGLLSGYTDHNHNCMLAKVKKFDHKKMKAEVIPLFKYKSNNGTVENRKPLIEVPVSFMYANGFFIRPPLVPGDLVVLIISDEDMDKVLMSGEEEEPNTSRKNDLSDAIVVACWQKFTEELPIQDGNEKDLVISNKNTNFSIIIKEDGKIEVESNNEITVKSPHIKTSGNVFLGDFEASEGVPLGDTLKAWLDSHTHPAPGGTTGSPNSASPNPSQVVKTI
jgi:hypothetical protein